MLQLSRLVMIIFLRGKIGFVAEDDSRRNRTASAAGSLPSTWRSALQFPEEWKDFLLQWLRKKQKRPIDQEYTKRRSRPDLTFLKNCLVCFYGHGRATSPIKSPRCWFVTGPIIGSHLIPNWDYWTPGDHVQRPFAKDMLSKLWLVLISA